MTLKRFFIAILIIFIIIAAALMMALNSWTKTPHGPLDMKVALLLKYIEWKDINLFKEEKTPEEIRKQAADSSKILKDAPYEIKSVKDTAIPGKGNEIPVRMYTPEEPTPLPVVIYFHGGGWFMGDLDSHDNLCRSIAGKSGSVVLSVDYRLAPEHPFPAAFDDAYAALLWTAQNAASIGGDPAKIFVAGDSAGGNLAAVVSLATKERGGPPVKGQVLIYPATNLAELNTPSHAHFGKGYYLTRDYILKFREFYLPNRADWRNPYVSPLLADDLSGLPPAFVITAQFDVLRDEGEAYAERLRQAGVPVKVKRYEGMIHGFVNMERLLGQAEQATDDIADFLKAQY